MPSPAKLKVVLCWHMHQPPYRDGISGLYQLPWAYLHMIKDYVDMAAHLEACPSARVVVNFSPILLEQIEDYAAQVRGFITNTQAIRDPILGALAQAALPVDKEACLPLIKACLRAHQRNMIARFPAYQHLADVGTKLLEQPISATYLSEQFLADLVVWHHLAWLGETVRRNDVRAQRLLAKARDFTLHDRRELLVLIGELLSGIVARYRRMAEEGRIELSLTPYAHPILPLLLDFNAARESIPNAPLPQLGSYPLGEERSRWHLREGIEIFHRHFGFTPKGCWPSEGALSESTLGLIAEFSFLWTASGEGVLRHTLAHAGHAMHEMKEAWLYHPYKNENGLYCFFRDDSLSDLIGFTYSTWHADDAVNDFVHHLEKIADRCKDHPNKVVSIILDGENAWEHYPENGYHFLTRLYERLSKHPQLTLTTFSDCRQQDYAKRLPKLIAGSWVHGTLSTWIGDTDKNRGWDMLGDVAHALTASSDRLSAPALAAAKRQLALCESSDWFWWFGDYNPATAVSDFERLYRLHLTNLYQMLGLEPPEYLSHTFTRGVGAPLHGGAMRAGTSTENNK